MATMPAGTAASSAMFSLSASSPSSRKASISPLLLPSCIALPRVACGALALASPIAAPGSSPSPGCLRLRLYPACLLASVPRPSVPLPFPAYCCCLRTLCLYHCYARHCRAASATTLLLLPPTYCLHFCLLPLLVFCDVVLRPISQQVLYAFAMLACGKWAWRRRPAYPACCWLNWRTATRVAWKA